MQPRYDYNKIEAIILERYKREIGVPDGNFDPSIALLSEGAGRPREYKNLVMFAKVDDLVEDGESIRSACKTVHEEYRPTKVSRGFYVMYHEFKRGRNEAKVRKPCFAYAVLEGQIDEAVEQYYRLSKITDVTTRFCEW